MKKKDFCCLNLMVFLSTLSNDDSNNNNNNNNKQTNKQNTCTYVIALLTFAEWWGMASQHIVHYL